MVSVNFDCPPLRQKSRLTFQEQTVLVLFAAKMIGHGTVRPVIQTGEGGSGGVQTLCN